MAYLSIANKKTKILLKPFHRFGRLSESVDTLVSHPEISRLHAIIEWINEVWFIRDISKNGLWINNKKVNSNTLNKLSIGDKVRFSEVSDMEFVVENLDKPKDLLVPQQNNNEENDIIENVVFLEQYNFLPSEESPEVVIFYDIESQSWYCEHTQSMTTQCIDDGACIRFSDSLWQLVKGADKGELETAEASVQSAKSLLFVFNISQDEEETELQVIHNNCEIDLSIRTHHYLIVLLARYKEKMQNIELELEDGLQGWVSIQNLSRDLGLSESHINIQIHRARKQLTDAFENIGLIAPTFIERKKGYVRFAADNFKIFKGNKLESITTS